MASSIHVAGVDTDLYSRQLGVLGLDAQVKLLKARVLIISMTGVGVEIAKNAILAGPKEVHIVDTATVSMSDLSSNFYLLPEDVGKCRGALCVKKLQELNPRNVAVKFIAEALSPAMLTSYDCVVMCDGQNTALVKLVNQICRTQSTPIPFILAEAPGISCFAFCDFGHSFTVIDRDGEDVSSAILSHISNDKKCEITVPEDARLPFYTGDTIQLKEVVGMEALNGKHFKVGKCFTFTFQLLTLDGENVDTSELGMHKPGSGSAVAVKVPFKMQFSSFEESLAAPYRNYGEFPQSLMLMDFRKFGRVELLHLYCQTLFQYRHMNGGSYPRPGNRDDAHTFCQLSKSIVDSQKKDSEFIAKTCGQFNNCLTTIDQVIQWDEETEKIISRLVMHSAGSLSPMTAFLGGVVGQEVIKAVTHKFTPLHQWLHFDALESLSETILPEEEYAPMSCRYDAQIAVFGKTLHHQLQNCKFFMIGAGALGCEFAKAFALMGMATGEHGCLYITDMDDIEKSNLNRQFLFRERHLGSSKSKAVAGAIKEINADVNVTYFTEAVMKSTEDVFNSDFWSSLDFVCNALDNVKAREYVDEQCCFYGKPLLESGTLGSKANVQIILPHMTECYRDFQDAPEAGIARCTLRSFPSTIVHCIEWSSDEEAEGSLKKLFGLDMQEAAKFLEDSKSYLATFDTQSCSAKHESLTRVLLVLQAVKDASWSSCVTWARLKFEELFSNEIKQLLLYAPPDHKTKEGIDFWSGPKRCPSPLVFNIDDPIHMKFLESAANLRAFNFGLTPNPSSSSLREAVAAIEIPPFQPKKYKFDESGENLVVESSDNEDALLDALLTQLHSVAATWSSKSLKPVVFEKDDDANFHIDYMTAASNLRARNYKIEETDRVRVKNIAGRIIPAMATTTAMITGLVLVQLSKIIQKKPIETFFNATCNLAIHAWGFSEPLPPKPFSRTHEYKMAKITADMMGGEVVLIPKDFSSWDHLLIDKGPRITLQDMFDWFENEYHLDVNSVAGDGKIYYLGRPSDKPRLSKSLVDLFLELHPDEKVGHKKYLFFACTVSDDSDVNEVVIPGVIYPEQSYLTIIIRNKNK